VSRSIDLRKNINTYRYGNESIDVEEEGDNNNLNNNNNNNKNMIKLSKKCKSLMLRRKT